MARDELKASFSFDDSKLPDDAESVQVVWIKDRKDERLAPKLFKAPERNNYQDKSKLGFVMRALFSLLFFSVYLGGALILKNMLAQMGMNEILSLIISALTAYLIGVFIVEKKLQGTWNRRQYKKAHTTMPEDTELFIVSSNSKFVDDLRKLDDRWSFGIVRDYISSSPDFSDMEPGYEIRTILTRSVNCSR